MGEFVSPEGFGIAGRTHSTSSSKPLNLVSKFSVPGLAVLFVLLLAAEPVHAQSFGATGVEAQGVSFHRFSRPGEATVRVWVVADTRSGLYEIGEGVSLGELLVLSGTGPGIVTVRERRNTTVRVYRGDRSQRGMIYEASFEEMLQNPGEYPSLQNEDAVVVETRVRQRFGWRDTLQIVSGVSTVLILVDRWRRVF